MIILEPVFREFFLTKTRKELQEAFIANKVPNGPVQTIPEMMSMPQLIERNMIIPVKDPAVGDYKAIGNPMKMDKTPPAITKAAPLLGEDTDKVLAAFGIGSDDTQKLRAVGAI